jgi:hypothetical protein
MTWFRDPYGHIIESRNKTHRLVYCSLCQKLASKSDCVRLRLSIRNGKLYEIKSYKYDKPPKVQRMQKGVLNKLQANPDQELTKMIGDVI